MKIKTSELTGAALDWAVWKCSPGGIDIRVAPFKGSRHLRIHDHKGLVVGDWGPSTHWAQGGPIIERELIILDIEDDMQWVAATKFDGPPQMRGPTPLIAAMRCFVASRLGDEVDVPEKLVNHD